MNVLAALILAGAASAALIDWVAVGKSIPVVEAVAKPVVMVLLIAAVVFGGTAEARWLVVAGLAASLLGDVALLPRFDRFVVGLGAFLVAHLFFIAAFLAAFSESSIWIALAGVTLCLALAAAGIIIVKAATAEDRRLRTPVAIYMLVLSAMLIVGSLGPIVAAAGAALFATSDAVLGWNRFVQPLAHGRLATHMLYHAGQWLLAVWVIGL